MVLVVVVVCVVIRAAVIAQPAVVAVAVFVAILIIRSAIVVARPVLVNVSAIFLPRLSSVVNRLCWNERDGHNCRPALWGLNGTKPQLFPAVPLLGVQLNAVKH